jgi:hypothetical protein
VLSHKGVREKSVPPSWGPHSTSPWAPQLISLLPGLYCLSWPQIQGILPSVSCPYESFFPTQEESLPCPLNPALVSPTDPVPQLLSHGQRLMPNFVLSCSYLCVCVCVCVCARAHVHTFEIGSRYAAQVSLCSPGLAQILLHLSREC